MEGDMDEREAGRIIGDVSVSYTVRELLTRMEERQIRMETRAEGYATQAHVEKLASQNKELIDKLSEKVDSLESYRDRIYGVVIGVSLLFGGGAGYLTNFLTQ